MPAKKCPHCQKTIPPLPQGRPKVVDDAKCLRFYRKLKSYKRVAEILKLPKSTVQSAIIRATHLERKAFEERCKKR